MSELPPTDVPDVEAAPKRRVGLVVAIVAFVVAATALWVAVWATDFVTMQGEWTIYSARCSGTWQDRTCKGMMTPAERYRFRALKAHREVLSWTVGDDQGESGRYTQCVIQDGRNWSCPVNDHASRTITHEMAKGVAVRDPQAPHAEFRAIPKWKWEALARGLPVPGNSASH